MSHDKNRQPFVGSGRAIEGGALATRKQDFNAHAQGNGFRHGAVDVDMHDPLTQLSGLFSDQTVQGTLEKMADFLECVGQGFITIGDGYGSSCGSEITIGDPGIPDLESAFTEAFSRDRLRNGGIVLVKAGEYVLSSTVTVPAGISIMGEIAGTRIVGETSEVSMFSISASTERPDIDIDSAVSTEEPLDKTTFFNLTLMDNADGNAASGNPTMQTVPMIVCERGSHLSCDQVTFLGRMGTLGAGPSFGRVKTLRAIGYTTGSTAQTTLNVERCTVDGFRNFLDFSSGGADDKLRVDKCRVRVFGSEDAGDTADRTINCFITSSGSGDIRITNNYMLSDATNSQVTALLTVVSGSPNVMFIGNQGSLIFNPLSAFTAFDTLIANVAGTTFNSTISGNTFDDKHIQNEWFLTVGDGTLSIGDITGPDAINVASSYADDEAFISTVYVNRGTYTFDGTYSGIMNLIGADMLSELPIINCTSSSPDTLLGNGICVFGRQLRNLRFKAPSSFQSIVPAGGSEFLQTIENCHFENITLLIPNYTSTFSDALGNDEKGTVVIKDCSFVQDGTYADNLSLIAPIVHNTVIENCTFSGSGYALAIGEFTGYSSTFTTSDRNLTLRNLIIDASDGGFTASSPLTGNDRYVTIQDEDANVNIENCVITVDNDLSEATSLIDAGLVTTFTRFVDVFARSVIIDNTIVHGPHQTFEDSGDTFALPTVRLTAKQNIQVDKSSFVGALPMQITGDPDLLEDEFQLRGIGIYNSKFRSPDNADDITMTTLDIDFDIQALATTYTQVPKIDVINNVFDQRLSASSRPVLHENNDPSFSSYYVTQGIVQIYAGLADINFTENKVLGNLRPFGAVDGSNPDNPYFSFAGVHIDGYSLDKFSGLTGLAGNVTHVHNNTIKVVNEYDTADSTEIATALGVVGNITKITNNYLTLVNLGVANIGTGGFASPQNVACALALFAAPATSTTFGDSVVTGNTFSRRDEFGIAFPHKITTVLVFPGSASGICVDNAFSDIDVDGIVGSASVQFFGPVPPFGATGPWTVERNRNQLVIEDIATSNGRFTITRPAATSDHIATGIEPTTDNHIIAGYTGLVNDMIAVYNQGTSTYRYIWTVHLNDVLPPNVEILGASINLDTNGFFSSGTATAAVSYLLDQDFALASGTGVIDLVATAGSTILAIPIFRLIYYTTPGLNPYLQLDMTFTDPGGGQVRVGYSRMAVLYKY